MPVHMELSRIIISEINDQQVIYLKEVDGERSFPILIGIFEATSIDRRVKNFHTPRPLTHDLLSKFIAELGGVISHVLVNDLRDDTYYARIVMGVDGETIEIDSRPSDAMALAVRADVPIFVDEEVMEKASITPEDDQGDEESEDLSAFRDFVNTLDLDDIEDD